MQRTEQMDMVGDAIAQKQTTFAIFEDASNISGYGLNFFFILKLTDSRKYNDSNYQTKTASNADKYCD